MHPEATSAYEVDTPDRMLPLPVSRNAQRQEAFNGLLTRIIEPIVAEERPPLERSWHIPVNSSANYK